jgi:hypothetical protein
MAWLLSEIQMRDPFIVESTPGEFVLFGTTDTNLWGGPGTGFNCFTSTDLEHWEGPVEAFRPPNGFWADTQFWAPEVHAYGGRFYMLATFASSKPEKPYQRGTCVLVADDVTGPYLPWSEGPVTPHDLPCLDGTLYVDENQVPWIVYSRGAEGVIGRLEPLADGEMYARQLSADLREPAGEPVLLFKSSAAAWSKPMRLPGGMKPPPELNLADDPMFTDGAYLFKNASGQLQMLWSSFGDSGYAMGVATSESGNVLGPWIQNAEPVWPVNGGHGMLLRTSMGSDFLVFHWPNQTPDERAKLAPVLVSDTGLELL